jgi:hypothetical protein
VLPTTDFQVELNDVTSELTAGGLQSAFTVTYRDRFGNLTDSTVGAVIVRPTVGTDRDTIPMTRLAKGEYRAERTPFTKAGTYLVTIAGINAANIRGDSAFTVVPDAASKAVFQSVPVAINFGALLPVFTVRYRDRFDNPTDFDGEVRYSNAQSPFVQAGLTPLKTGIVPTTRTALSVSTATAPVPMTVAGEFALSVQGIPHGISTLSGTSAFTVRPLAAASAEIRNLQERLSAGDSLPPFIVLYRDKAGNVADYNRDLVMTRVGTSATVTVPMRRLALGVSTASVSAVLAAPGTYRLTVPGLATVSGATTVVVTSTNAVSRVDFFGVTPVVTAGSTLAAFSVYFRTAQDVLADMTTATLRFTMARDSLSAAPTSGTIALTRQETGIYTAEAQTFTRAGSYTLTVDGIGTTTGTRSFVVVADTNAGFIRIDSLVNEVTVNTPIPRFYASFFDNFGNAVSAFTPVILRNTETGQDTTLPLQSLGNGRYFISNIISTTIGTFTVTAANVPIVSDNTTIRIIFPRPIISSIDPPQMPVGFSTEITIEGDNFADDAVAFYKNVQLSVTRINSKKMKAIVPIELLATVGIDSLYIRNQEYSINSYPPKGVARLQNACRMFSGPAERQSVEIDGNEGIFNICINGTLPFSACTTDVDVLPVFRIGTNTTNFTVSREPDGYTVRFSKLQLETVFRDIQNGSYPVSLVKERCTTTASSTYNHTENIFILNPTPIFNSIQVGGIEVRSPIIVTPAELTAPYSVSLLGSGFVKNSELLIDGINNCSTCFISKSSIGYSLNPSFPPGVVTRTYRFAVRNPVTFGFTSGGTTAEKMVTFQFTTPRINDVLVRGSEFPPRWHPLATLPAERDTTIRIWGDNFIAGSTVIIKNAAGNPSGIRIDPGDVTFGSDLTDNSRRTQNYLEVRLRYSQILTLKGNNFRNIIDKPVFLVVENTKGISNVVSFIVGKPLVKIERTEGTISAGRTSTFSIVGKKFVNYIALNDTSTTRVFLGTSEIRPIQLIDSTANPDNFQRISLSVHGDSLLAARMSQQSSRNRLIVVHRQEGRNAEYRLADTTYIYPVALQPSLTAILNPQNNRPLRGMVQGEATTFTLVGDNITSESALNIQGTLYQSARNVSGASAFGTIGFSLQQPTRVNARILATNAPLVLGRNLIGIQNPLDAEGTPNRAWHFSNTLNINVYDRATLPRILSISPRNIKATEDTARIRVFGQNFDANTLINLKISPCSQNSTNAPPDSMRLTAQDITLISATEMIITLPASYRMREGIVEMSALNTDEVMYPGGVVKLGIRENLPTIRRIQTLLERPYRKPDPIWGFLGFGKDTTEIKVIDSLYTGTPGGAFKQKHFIINGENLNGIRCFSGNTDSASTKIYFEGNAIKTTVISDSVLHFGFSSALIPNEQYLTFRPGAYRFKVIDKDGFESDEVAKTVFARTPTIANITPPTISMRFDSSAAVTITSGHNTLAPGAKDFIVGSNIRLTGVDDIARESFAVQFDTAQFSLRAIIRAADVPFVRIQERRSVELPDAEPTPFAYESRPALLRVLNSTPFLGAGANIASQSVNLFIRFLYPQPTVSALQPTSIPVDDQDTTVVITGTNFIAGETTAFSEARTGEPFGFGNLRRRVRFDLPTQVLSQTRLRVTIPPYLRNQAAEITLVVFNGTFGSALLRLNVIPVPRIFALEPDSLSVRIFGEAEPTDTVVTIRGKYLDSTSVLWNADATVPLPILPGRTDSLIRVIVPTTFFRANNPIFPLELRENNGIFSLLLRYPNPNYATASAPIRLFYHDAHIDTLRPDTIEVPVSAAFIAFKDNASLNSDNNRRGEFPIVPGVLSEPILFPNAPNPFDDATTIEYTLPNDATVRLEVIDALGRKVAEPLEYKFHRAGTYSLRWSPQNSFPSGIYTAVLQCVDAKGKVIRKTLRMTRIR